MKQNSKDKKPMQENTKDDSSDIEKVKKDLADQSSRHKHPSATTPRSGNEEEEAEKGHS